MASLVLDCLVCRNEFPSIHDGEKGIFPEICEKCRGAGKPKTSAQRKSEPIYSGVLKYFPDAIAAVSRVSKAGNDKHNPGEPLHWSRGKSNDHLDCVTRHIITPEETDPDSGEIHLAHAAWRVLAALQLAEEKRLGIIKE